MASRKDFPLNAHLPIAKQLKKPFTVPSRTPLDSKREAPNSLQQEQDSTPRKRYRIEETLFDDNAKDDDSIYIFSVLQLVSNYLVLHLTLRFLI